MKIKVKHVLLFLFQFILLIEIITSYVVANIGNEVYEEEKQKIKDIAMMLEQTAGAGDYKMVKRSKWPDDGYIFNKELSSCKNGSKIIWDEDKKAIKYTGRLTDECTIYFDIFSPSNISEVCNTGDNLTNCIVSLGNKGSNDITKIYHHDSSLTNGASDNSYRYAGGDYQVTDKAISAGLNNITTNDATSTNGIINLYCNGTKQNIEYKCSSSSDIYYTLQYDTSNTHFSTYNNALEKATADGYLTKDNIKNYVCFGSNTTTCPTGCLYRIIGVIDGKIKLIEADYAWGYSDINRFFIGDDGDYSYTIKMANTVSISIYRGKMDSLSLYYWNKATSINTWSESLLNKTNLNINFINNIGTTWSNKIATTTWKVGGGPFANIRNVVPATAYQYEVGNSASTTTYDAKIGLMYISDYGFAANPNFWSIGLDSYSETKDINWMHMGLNEWTITRESSTSNTVIFIENTGNLQTGFVTNDYFVRPVFFLDSSITYVSGDGTQSSPIRIN